MNRRLVCFVLGALLASSARLSAGDLDRIRFDIFDSQGQVVVWLDLSPVISARRISQLKDGVDVAVECRALLRRPRKIWGSELIAESSRLLRIGYRLITEDYRLTDYSFEPQSELTLLSLAKLHHYLADSVAVEIGARDLLDVEERYFIEIQVVCISLTSINLASDGDREKKSESPVKYLFRKFLELTDFGREDFSARSRTFSAEEIPRVP
ncbi:MAG: DUF4390 domain-containing protein [Candidatus Zixiibacteriota bacterium]|nr:MAG: DUF4390 domain-containing protein [candidate division Zixibacteria bacterium]